MSEGLVQGYYMVAGVGFEPVTLRAQGTELATKPPLPTTLIDSRGLSSAKLRVCFVLP